MGTIVVGYVSKPEGEAALRRAIEEATLRKSRVVVVNSARGGDDFDGRAARQAAEAMQHVTDHLESAGVDHEVRQLVRGHDPSEDLIEVAAENDAEMIVIGLRRRSAVGKLILGSNAQRILLDAPCAVLAVKADA